MGETVVVYWDESLPRQAGFVSDEIASRGIRVF